MPGITGKTLEAHNLKLNFEILSANSRLSYVLVKEVAVLKALSRSWSRNLVAWGSIAALLTGCPGKAFAAREMSPGMAANHLALDCAAEACTGRTIGDSKRAIIAPEASGDPKAVTADLRQYFLRDTFERLNILAAAYYIQGRYNEAEHLLRYARIIAHENFPPSDPGLAEATANLALVYQAEGRVFYAVVMLSRALKAGETAFGPDNSWVATIAARLAVIYAEKGAAAEAEALFKRAIAIWEKSPETDGPSLSAALFNLAALYARQSRFEEAGALFKPSADLGGP